VPRHADDAQLLRAQRVDEGGDLLAQDRPGDEHHRCAGIQEGPSTPGRLLDQRATVGIAWGAHEDVGAGVEDEVDPGLPAGPQHRLHRGDGVVERLHLVLEVAADDAGSDRPARGLPRVAVAGLEVHRHRQVHGGHDAADHVEVELERDVLAVLVAEGGRDRVACRRQGPDPLGSRYDPRGDDVPDVGQDQDLRGAVQVEQGAGARREIGHGAEASAGVRNRQGGVRNRHGATLA
jgi:hypothetical protein